jgi:hypothetical protein
MKPKRILAGELINKKLKFRFRVLAFRKMSKSEVRHNFEDWYHNQRDKRRSLRNRTVTLVTDFGMRGGFF